MHSKPALEYTCTACGWRGDASRRLNVIHRRLTTRPDGTPNVTIAPKYICPDCCSDKLIAVESQIPNRTRRALIFLTAVTVAAALALWYFTHG